MATNTTETKSTRTRKTTTKTTEKIPVVDTRISELQAENAQMKEQLEQLMSMLKNQNGATSQTNEVQEDDGVMVISLVPHKLNLCTEWGSGAIYTFNEMYEAQEIDWGDLKAIVRTNRDMVQKGRFYIADEKAVSKLRLKGLYGRLLSPDDLRGLFNQQPDKVIEMYNIAPDGQKESIVDMVVTRLESGEKVDANILQHLSKISGKDLMKLSNE